MRSHACAQAFIPVIEGQQCNLSTPAQTGRPSEPVVAEMFKPQGMLSGLGWGVSRILGLAGAQVQPTAVRGLFSIEAEYQDGQYEDG